MFVLLSTLPDSYNRVFCDSFYFSKAEEGETSHFSQLKSSNLL